MEWDKQLLAKIAYLYYIENKTQNEIAAELNIYRTTISRMLKQARAEGIVSITIPRAKPALFSLEQYVKKKFGLREVVLVPDDPKKSESEKDERLSEAAAFYLKRIISPDSVIGVSWGSTLAGMVKNIEKSKNDNTLFLPLVGGPSYVNARYHVNTIVYDMARRFHGKTIFVDATVIQESKEVKEGIMNSKYFEELKSYWEKLDIALVGVGGPLSVKNSQWRDLLTQADYEELTLREAVGDCCCQFIDQAGKILKGDLYQRTIAIDLEKLRQVPYSIGIARTKAKSRPLLALVNKKYINVLITDEEAALELLKLAEDENWFKHSRETSEYR